jgi:hypothetical protein
MEKQPHSKEQATEKKLPKTGSIGRDVASVFTGDVLSRENILRNLPFMFFLTFLVVVYIGYGYYTARTSKKLHQLETTKRELASDMINEQSNLNLVSMPSQIADSTERKGLRPSTSPPIKIKVNPSEYLVIHD